MYKTNERKGMTFMAYTYTNIERTEENDQFQYGNCEFLATEMNKHFGYKIMNLVRVFNDGSISNRELLSLNYDNYSEELEKDNSIECIHCFCSTVKDGKTYYIDSLGITDDINDILGRYDVTLEDLEDINTVKGGTALIDFNYPDYLESCGWTTYFDENPYDYDFYDKTWEERTLPAIEFIEKYKDLLII